MFDFLIPVAIFGFGGYFLYKIFELYGMRGERKSIIERLDAAGLTEYVKRMPIGIGGGNAEAAPQKRRVVAVWPLRIGLAIMGFGAGIILGYLISQNGFDDVYNIPRQFEALWMASASGGTGLGLFLSFIIETIITKRSKE